VLHPSFLPLTTSHHLPSPFFEHCVASKTGLVTSIVVRSIPPSPPSPPPPHLRLLLFRPPPYSLHLLTSHHLLFSHSFDSIRLTSLPPRLSSPYLAHLAHLCVIGSCSQQQTTYHPDNTTLPSKPRRIVQLVRIPLASTVSSSTAPRPHPSELLDRQQSSGVPLEDKADEEQALRLPIPSSHQQLHMISKLPSETVSL
jgi:hypothetical protein